jgi:glyoxylase-like metal-dependent hydrolase (beta-lactamase superfamily II)
MKLHAINTGYFKLDGGAMFGTVPKSIWNKLNPADENNLCIWAMRCLLIEDENKLILIDNGIGNKQDEKFFNRYCLHGNETLETSLNRLGFSFSDITDVVLSHLHFDHCGGSTRWNEKLNRYELTFPNAVYWNNEIHWNASTNPNKRESASFLPENIIPIKNSGQLKFINEDDCVFRNIDFTFKYGHTEALILPMINYRKRAIFFMSDFIPSTWHIRIPYVMAFDNSAKISITEKETFLNDAADKNYILFFEHDPLIECCTVARNGKDFSIDKTFTINEIL